MGKPDESESGGELHSDCREQIEVELKRLAEAPEVDAAGLKRQVRRLLVLDLAEARDAYNRRETIKMLADVEGYKKVVVGETPSSDTESALERMSRAASQKEE